MLCQEIGSHPGRVRYAGIKEKLRAVGHKDDCLTLVVRLGLKKPQLGFASLKILSRVARSHFMTFPKYEWGHKMQQSDHRSVHRKLFGLSSNTHELF